MKLPIRLRALEEIDILECITLFQNTIHTVNVKDYSFIQLEAREGYLDRLFVHKDFQGQVIAAAIV